MKQENEVKGIYVEKEEIKNYLFLQMYDTFYVKFQRIYKRTVRNNKFSKVTVYKTNTYEINPISIYYSKPVNEKDNTIYNHFKEMTIFRYILNIYRL